MTERQREPTLLEIMEDTLNNQISVSDDPHEVKDALTELGLTHVSMGPGRMRRGMQEIWAGMHGRSGLENLGIIARVASGLVSLPNNYLTNEQQVAFNQDRDAARQQHADEQ